MKLIAIPTRDGMVDDHFGHCAYYTVVTLDEQNQVVKQERLDSSKSEAQNAPTPITTYAFFRDGEYLTNEQMNDKRFLKVIKC